MSDRAESDVRLTLLGPMPPPVHGQSVVMSQMVERLTPRFPDLRVADISEGDAVGAAGAVTKIQRSMAAFRAIPGSDAVYIAVKAGRGMWLSTAAAGLARAAGARVFLHHHSYAYVRERLPRMVALTRAAGADAHHIVLSESMAAQLHQVMPEIERTLVIGNAGLVAGGLLDLPLRSDGSELVLGHLSNLSLDKGIAEVVDLACALHRAGSAVRLIVGGPTDDYRSCLHLDRAAGELGESFEYRGPLRGAAKSAFYERITHFVFPTRYVHEAVPLVLYEAMAAGAVCVTTRQGSIPEQVQGSPSLLAQNADSFVAEMVPLLATTAVSTAASKESRQAYLRALAASEGQLRELGARLEGVTG